MEAYYDLVGRLVKALGTAGLNYAFTGALAASFYGLPRSTTDIDVMVQISSETAKRKLASALKRAGVNADQKEIDIAAASGYGIARFTDTETPYSVDVILTSEKLERRTGAVAHIQTFFQAPEGLISAKLRMIKATLPRERAFKDEEDIKAILKFTGANVEAIKKRAKEDTTLSIFKTLIAGNE